MWFQRKSEFKIFDPRRGEDWVETTRTGKTVSIRHAKLLLLRYTAAKAGWPSELSQFDEFIRTSMQHTGTLGFLSVSSLNERIRASFPPCLEIQEVQGSALGYFALETQAIDQCLALRKSLSFQVLIVGSLRERLSQPLKRWKTYAWDIDYILEHSDSLGCLSRFDSETETLEFFTKLYPDLDSCLEELAQQRHD